MTKLLPNSPPSRLPVVEGIHLGSAATDELAFDAGWYVRAYADVGDDAFAHYVAHGAAEGRSPNAYFDELFYRSRYPDVAEAVAAGAFVCGFEHYVLHGRQEQRKPRRPDLKCAIDLSRLPPQSRGPSYEWRMAETLLDALEAQRSWDVVVLFSDRNQAALQGMHLRDMTLLNVDRCADGVEAWLKREDVTTFIATCGSSEFLHPRLKTIVFVTGEQLLPDLALGIPAGRTPASRQLAARAVADHILCPSERTRADLVRLWSVDPDRISVVPVRPAPPLLGSKKQRAILERFALAPQTFVLAPLASLPFAKFDAVVRGFDAFARQNATTDWTLVCLVRDAAVRRSVAATFRCTGLQRQVLLVEQPSAEEYDSLIANAFAVVDPSRDIHSSVSAIDALDRGVPVLCDEASDGLDEAARAVIGLVPEEAASVTAALGRVLAARKAVSRVAAGSNALRWPFEADRARAVLCAAFDAVTKADPRIRPQVDAVFGIDDASEFDRAVHIQVRSRQPGRLIMGFSTPADLPAPVAVYRVFVNDLPMLEGQIPRGTSASFTVPLDDASVMVTVALSAIDDEGKAVDLQPLWPRMRLRNATLQLVPRDLLLLGRDTAVGNGGTWQRPDYANGDEAVASINDLVDFYGPVQGHLAETVEAAREDWPALRLTVPAVPVVHRVRQPQVLHIVRRQYFTPGLEYHGSNKDQTSRAEYFRSRGFSVDARVGYDNKYGPLLNELDHDRYADYQVILVESIVHLPLMEALRERFPRAKLLVRSHNAEILHRIDTHMASMRTEEGGLMRGLLSPSIARRLQNVLAHYRFDHRAAEICDGILSICDWESENYWPKLTSRDKIITVPYFLPTGMYDDTPVPAHRAQRCVCLTSAAPGPINVHAAQRFVDLVNRSGQTLDGWEMVMTGDPVSLRLPPSPRVRQVGMVEDPIAEMRGSSAMVMLSPYGYGMKTKILDAIQAGCFTLLPESLLRRQPKAVHPYCIAVDGGSPGAFRAALERSLGPWPGGDPNAALRDQAFAALDRYLGLGPRS